MSEHDPISEQSLALEAVGDAERLGRIYAEALFDVAEKQDQTRAIAEDLDALIDDVLAKNPTIENYLSGSGATRAEKGALLDRAISGKVDPLLLDFLQVVNRNNRLMFLRPMRAAYRVLCDEKAKRTRVKVRTAVELDDQQLDRLADLLRRRLGREPVLETRVEPGLLGGIVVQIGDDVYDGSVLSKLDGIKKQLLARSNYAIQHGRDRFRTDE